LFAAGGPVDIRFEGSDALFRSTVSVNGSQEIFPNHTTPIGTSRDLGTFSAGTALDVVLHVLTTGQRFRTGPGAFNPDGLAHALVTFGDNGRIFVGFEDVVGGGDRDFNDHRFSLTNVRTVAAVPEPATVAMLFAGLGLVGLLARRRDG
ncbi:MAG TPA: PEP-CTERM sorting domain-containing protein, partial [Albitalea sp.]